jgi:hypothetical protein
LKNARGGKLIIISNDKEQFLEQEKLINRDEEELKELKSKEIF